MSHKQFLKGIYIHKCIYIFFSSFFFFFFKIMHCCLCSKQFEKNINITKCHLIVIGNLKVDTRVMKTDFFFYCRFIFFFVLKLKRITIDYSLNTYAPSWDSIKQNKTRILLQVTSTEKKSIFTFTCQAAIENRMSQ